MALSSTAIPPEIPGANSNSGLLLHWYGDNAHNGRETLGLRPALRQAALVCRRGRGRGGASGDQATVGRTTSPLRGTPCGSLFSTPSAKGERGLPTRHSLRERRLPLDVGRNRPSSTWSAAYPGFLYDNPEPRRLNAVRYNRPSEPREDSEYRPTSSSERLLRVRSRLRRASHGRNGSSRVEF